MSKVENAPLRGVTSCSKREQFSQYQYISRARNPNYESSLVPIPFRVKCSLSKYCVQSSDTPDIIELPSGLSIKHNNVTAGSPANDRTDAYMMRPMVMATQPRNITKLLKTTFDANTGEMTMQDIIETNDTFARLNRRKRALNAFLDVFEPMYASRRVTMLFMTFTLANENGNTLRKVLDQFKKRCKRNGFPCLGYFWVMEISEDLHVHYHALVAIDRINVRGRSIPSWWKLDELWGAACRVEMVKRSIRGYLAKYIGKGHEKIEGKRMYGRSMPARRRKNIR
jgi:hypothetical protein